MKQIIYTIQDNNATELATGFLAACPIPLDAETGDPTMSALEWIEQCGKKYFMDVYEKGIKIIAKRTAIIETGLIE